MLAAAFLAERRIVVRSATSTAPDSASGGVLPDGLVRAVRIDPTRRGVQAMTFSVVNAAGELVLAQGLTATLSSARVAALRLTLRRLTPDGSHWAASAAVVPLPGLWTLTLDVALGPADAYATSVSYRVW
jgi:hypothetical protein